MLKKKHIKKKDTYTQVIYVQLKPTFALKEKKKEKKKKSYSMTSTMQQKKTIQKNSLKLQNNHNNF